MHGKQVVKVVPLVNQVVMVVTGVIYLFHKL